jgi:LCP family protein required for cell wall assembly
VVLVIALGVGVDVYVNYRFGQIKKVHVSNLKTVSSKPGAPFTVLVAGSDSRTFVTTTSQCQSFGCGSETGGQRSDVIILVRVLPAAHKIEMLSIPRDAWVTIPGNIEYISGQNRINAAFNDGPSLLVQTIERDFHIPINYFVEVNFPGMENMVNAIGGVHLDFKYPVKDVVSGLRIRTTGCQLVQGAQALALVRSRHLQYEIKGVWYDNNGSDFTRILNQQAFFRAVIHQLNAQITNPFALNGFIGAAVHNLIIDQTMTEPRLKSLALEFHNFPPGSLQAVTLPTFGPYITSGGADVLLPAAAADEVVIQHFLDFGMPVKKATTTSQATSITTTTTSPPTVTTIASPPAGETPIYNNTSEPYDPTPC